MIKEAQGLIEAREERPKTKSAFQFRSSYSRLKLSIHVTLVGYVSRDPASYIKAGRVIDQGQAIHSNQNPDEINNSPDPCNPDIHDIKYIQAGSRGVTSLEGPEPG